MAIVDLISRVRLTSLVTYLPRWFKYSTSSSYFWSV